AYLGRAGWDNENTFQIQGERYLTLMIDMELIDFEQRLTETGEQVRGELTLPVHMSLLDIAAQLNPGGADAVRAEADAEHAPPQEAERARETGYHAVAPGSYARGAWKGGGARRSGAEEEEDGAEPEPPAAPPADAEPEPPAALPADAEPATPPAPSAGPPV